MPHRGNWLSYDIKYWFLSVLFSFSFHLPRIKDIVLSRLWIGPPIWGKCLLESPIILLTRTRNRKKQTVTNKKKTGMNKTIVPKLFGNGNSIAIRLWNWNTCEHSVIPHSILLYSAMNNKINVSSYCNFRFSWTYFRDVSTDFCDFFYIALGHKIW